MTKEEVIEILGRFVVGAKPCSQREIVDACASAYGMLKEKPSLPSNIDDAAQKVEDYYDVGEEHGYLCCHQGDIKDAFKAGAEWMAGQGDTKIGVATKDNFIKFTDNTYIDLDPTMKLIPAFKLKDDEEIVVQIRKK